MLNHLMILYRPITAYLFELSFSVISDAVKQKLIIGTVNMWIISDKLIVSRIDPEISTDQATSDIENFTASNYLRMMV
jgi:hypothetical protein